MELNSIKEVLGVRVISQTWLANKLGKSYNSVNAIVCNITQANLETLLQIPQILNVDMKDLIPETIDRTIQK
ncbi:MAG: helix-turn-helix transcriptional regulator [Bacteroidaceae bacterium]|nr:helix-turn-helix transcriptional regulator [Bacteroidaceae bacterium]